MGQDYAEELAGESAVKRDGMKESIALNRQNVEEVRGLLELLIRALVDRPDRVSVGVVLGLQSVIFEIAMHAADIRRVIGRKGRTANALREIVLNLGAKARCRYLIEIVEPEHVLRVAGRKVEP